MDSQCRNSQQVNNACSHYPEHALQSSRELSLPGLLISSGGAGLVRAASVSWYTFNADLVSSFPAFILELSWSKGLGGNLTGKHRLCSAD